MSLNLKPMLYKVHVPFVSQTGEIVQAGNYEEGMIDLAYARSRSIVTTGSDVPETVKPKPVPSDIRSEPFVLQGLDNGGYVVRITPAVQEVKIDRLKINSASIEALKAIKSIGKAIATKVVTLRSEQRFDGYHDLNRRVPLSKGRKWEDVTPIDFEYSVPVNNTNNLRFI
ncbi:hypothetical protein [Chroococcidiopsis sp.]|uniref:hypothetical protein n=1 Tax=Chroococcidiopsis sp. TaxID=3088168 RepID=UPI003F2D831A